jgi:hypothetical protein
MRRVRKFVKFFESPLGIFVVALLARLLYLLITILIRVHVPSGRLPIFHETGRIAQHIAEGRGFSSPLKSETGPTAWMTPIYPYLVAGVYKVLGISSIPSEIATKVLNNIFSALVSIPLFAIGRRLSGPAVGAAAAYLWILHYPAFFWPSGWIWDTSLSALALTLILWATYALDDADGAAAWAGYGGLWAFGTLVNAAVLSTFPGLLAYVAFRAHKRGAPWLRLTGLAIIVFIAGISPWVIRNQIVFNGKVFLRSNFGLELWLGNNPQVPDTWTWWLHPNENDQERLKFAQMGEVAYMQDKQRLAIEYIKTHPVDVARFDFHRFVENWTGTDEPIADVWKSMPLWVKAVLAYNCSFSLLALLGLVFIRRVEPIRYIPLLVILLFFPFIYYITHNTPRYRHPMEPAMALMVAYAVAYPLKTWRSIRTKEELPTVPLQAVS